MGLITETSGLADFRKIKMLNSLDHLLILTQCLFFCTFTASTHNNLSPTGTKQQQPSLKRQNWRYGTLPAAA